ncbi:RrF2 family transcriptional regulator [Acetivibrio mesophilus]|uniref:Rrf2 family transcriptional regulator n=1 Tax=Acetivibrio mesophilus TaxID=2487273 RepID=A0A4Q0I5C2_9FIRM|nr:Rrf2 family transcriptional regulator [Acetivibrio mesophilus]ODM26614.1 Rrf2 family transcriptional regulator [Clostridium sp. Bc-iso-3]RXE58955.1 Rrf2 family transcriptional regulator [Acetivibrio mesophilus]HHV28509.1 Rrf2 family transcriptional regulator [Clostridium sp.]
MKFSTKGRYGLRAMIDLAVYSNGEYVTLASIAERQGISTNYLEQVFSALRKSGLVKSAKGAQGGYVLSESPSDIKVGRILRVLEGPLSVTDEDDENLAGNESCIRNCIRINVWEKMNNSLNELVDSVTLEDLAEDYRKRNGIDNSMYYI